MAKNRHFGAAYSHFGEDTKGHDLKAFGDTTAKYLMWDASADKLVVAGDAEITGTMTYVGTLGLTGDLEISSQFLKGSRFTVTIPLVVPASVGQAFFIAPAACQVVSAYEVHGTACDAGDTMTIEKCASGEDAGAGDVVLASAWTLNSTVNTPVSKAAVADGKEILAAGDSLMLKLASGDATSYAQGCVTVTMEWL